MSVLQIWIFVSLLVFLLAKGFVKPQRFLEYPYFMAATFTVFILPQVISLSRHPGAAPLESLTPVMIMTNLCLAACAIGYRIPSNQWITRQGSTPVNLDRLFHVGAIFVLVSIFFRFLISQMSVEEMGGSTWTGRVTIYHFFSQLVYPGFAISLFTALTRRNSLAWIVSFLAALNPIIAIVFSGRRETTALFVLTIGLTLFYHRRFVPQRLLIAGGIVFAMLAIPATAKYRSAVSLEGVRSAGRIDLIGNFNRFLTEESVLELRNAAVLIYITAQSSDYEFGAAYWDQLIFRFVPAQLVGAGVKESLMFDKMSGDAGGDEDDETEIGIRTFKRMKGSTVTGMGDSFKQFGYFGCLFFALLAVIFRSLWETSLQPNTFLAKLLYIQLSTSAMRAVTHQTVDFLPGMAYNVIFLGLAVFYARVPRKQRTKSGDSSIESISALENPPVAKSLPTAAARPAAFLAPAKKRDLSELE